MTAAPQAFGISARHQAADTGIAGRDRGIDTMRGIAILMVIGIHSLQQPLDAGWKVLVDAALRPCVPVFLFASGYLTARARHVPLRKRIRVALIPYTFAFAAAYLYMALHNPAMDHRPTTTLARFVLAYVFVYYYVFVYIGCTFGLWLIFHIASRAPEPRQRLIVLCALAIALGLIAGSYLDPLLARAGVSDAVIQEARLRDIPFWFSFAALGVLVGTSAAGLALRDMRLLIAGATAAAYAVYAAVRLSGIGDAADYDSAAFFGYAALFCVLLLVLHPRNALIAFVGSGSYFIYLWHIFVVMALRDHTTLRTSGAVAESLATCIVTITASVAALAAVRRIAPRLSRWLGA
jgi:surface polysaccharide O-acyltransferase-like enzyme